MRIEIYKNFSIVRKITVIFLGLLIALFIILSRIFSFVCVNGPSMEPTFKDGDWVLCTRLFTKHDLFEASFPVCIVVSPDTNGLVIKRLIGKPGDYVEFVDGALYINDILVEEAHGDSWDNLSIKLAEDEWFFVGDNRRDSMDSRVWKGHSVPFESIKLLVI